MEGGSVEREKKGREMKLKRSSKDVSKESKADRLTAKYSD